jgi:hypothetical protein
MIHGNVLPLRSVRPFPFIAGLMANRAFAQVRGKIASGSMVLFLLFVPCRRRSGLFIQVNTWLETDRVMRVC